jgi:hypothetical protein
LEQVVRTPVDDLPAGRLDQSAQPICLGEVPGDTRVTTRMGEAANVVRRARTAIRLIARGREALAQFVGILTIAQPSFEDPGVYLLFADL